LLSILSNFKLKQENALEAAKKEANFQYEEFSLKQQKIH
jgi:hypothetical protein